MGAYPLVAEHPQLVQSLDFPTVEQETMLQAPAQRPTLPEQERLLQAEMEVHHSREAKEPPVWRLVEVRRLMEVQREEAWAPEELRPRETEIRQPRGRALEVLALEMRPLGVWALGVRALEVRARLLEVQARLLEARAQLLEEPLLARQGEQQRQRQQE